MRPVLASTWPQSSLSLSIGDVVLQVPDDRQLEQLAELAATPGGVLAPGDEHFVGWLAGREPAEIRQRLVETVRRHRDLRVRPGWTLDLAVLVDGVPVGMQSLAGFDRWPRRRIVGTSSWLSRPWQRRGIGTRARAAVLDLAMDELAAEAAMSWVLPANDASVRVSERLGYRVIEAAEPGEQLAEAKYRLDAVDWFARRPADLPRTRIEHADGMLGLLG